MPFLALPVALAIASVTGAVVSVAAVSAVLSFALSTAIAIGVSFASSALARSLAPDAPGDTGGTTLAQLNAPAVKASVKQATPPQRKIYGPQRFGGAFSFYKSKPGLLYIQHMYSKRKISRILGLNVNGQKIVFATSAFNTILSPLGIDGQPNYPGRLRACFQAGTLDQPINPLLAVAFPDLPAEWRLPGIANAVYEFEYGADWDERTLLWGNAGIPDVEPEAETAPIYDPRDPTQFLPDDPDDIEQWFAAQESWKYSDNSALIAADQLWQKDGMNAGPAGVDWTKIAEAADRCDEAVATRNLTSDGKVIYERRYTSGGVVDMDQEPAAVFDGLLTAFRSSMVQGLDGTAWVAHDGPKQPVFTITDDMIIGSVSYRGFKGLRDLANETVMRFVAPGRKYQLSDGPKHIRADLIAEDGSPFALNVNLPFTVSPSTAQRIAKADLEEARIESSWGGVINLQGLGIREDDCIQIASEICPHWNGLYLVDRWELVLNLSGASGMALNLVGYVPTISNDWNAAVDDKAHDVIDTEELLAA